MLDFDVNTTIASLIEFFVAEYYKKEDDGLSVWMSTGKDTDTDDEYYNKVLNVYSNKPANYEQILLEKMRKEKIPETYRRCYSGKSSEERSESQSSAPACQHSALPPAVEEEASDSDNVSDFISPRHLRSGRVHQPATDPQPSTSYASQARSSSPSSTTSRSKYKLSSDDEVFREESMPRRCHHVRKTQAKCKQKVKKSAEKARQMPDSDEAVESNDSDRTVIIKTEMSEENNNTRNSDSTTGYPSPPQVTIAKIHQLPRTDYNSDDNMICLS